jgi:hypothetical protein
LWKESLSKISEKAAQSLADPVQYENLFPDYGDSLKAEQFMQAESKLKIPASASFNVPVSHAEMVTCLNTDFKTTQRNNRFRLYLCSAPSRT